VFYRTLSARSAHHFGAHHEDFSCCSLLRRFSHLLHLFLAILSCFLSYFRRFALSALTDAAHLTPQSSNTYRQQPLTISEDFAAIFRSKHQYCPISPPPSVAFSIFRILAHSRTHSPTYSKDCQPIGLNYQHFTGFFATLFRYLLSYHRFTPYLRIFNNPHLRAPSHVFRYALQALSTQKQQYSKRITKLS
jgi:hypothetical protein